ncbi:MAG: glycosyltransferase [Spirochaetes bacterium]|nr:glycosyltransferase [Spirochaetota bacterium]
MIKNGFYENLIRDFTDYIKKEEKRFQISERLKIDLHCHDHNSNVPDELLGRLLGVSETWLPSEHLLKSLKDNNCDVMTITNHNNARSCYEMQDRGFDILTGAEFTVDVNDFNTKIHVLAYGFDPKLEMKLNKKRNNLYKFMETAAENNIPTIWAHPLFHYNSGTEFTLELFAKLSLVFERFEAVNGQRDTWQNMLVKTWVDSLTPEVIEKHSRKFKLSPDAFCTAKYRKTCTGGSDEHMGIFTGLTGSYLHVPDLVEKSKTLNVSQLALDALRRNEIAPFGSSHDSEKMMVAFIDYFCQIGINIKDPGLIRMLLHKGSPKDKLAAFFISNSFLELKRHKLTGSFLNIFHRSLLGEKPGLQKRIFVPRVYKPVFSEVTNISSIVARKSDETPLKLKNSIENIFNHLNDIIIDRLESKFRKYNSTGLDSKINFSQILENFEIPGSIRTLMTGTMHKDKNSMLTEINLGKITDGLSFPVLASSVILGAAYTAAHVLYNTRPLLEKFSSHMGKYRYPERMLWLTDTFEDGNGVSTVLKSILGEIRRKNLPIDLCVCSSELKSEKNLIVLKPLKQFSVSFYNNHPVRIPDIMELYNLFKQGEYDRVMSSTEGFMGAAALFLKKAYSVPAYFYIHTDWMTFSKKVLGLEKAHTDRLKRLLRAFYSGFDGVFTLNSDQYKSLSGSSFGLNKNRVYLTAHWSDGNFKPMKNNRQKLFGIGTDTPLILYAGRLSPEKGVHDIPYIYNEIKKRIPEIKIVFAGSGPSEEFLRKEIPCAVFTGWVKHSDLPDYYSSSDILILPSKFDTFGCVVLEALSCGIPVAAYRSKGPKDIIADRQCGYLADSPREIADCISSYFNDRKTMNRFKKAAVKKSAEYNSESIMEKFLKDIKMS